MSCVAWELISFKHWIIFHCLSILQFIYPFTYWRTFWLLPSFGNINKAAITSMCRSFFVCGHPFSTDLNKMLGAQLLDYMVRVCLVLQKIIKFSSNVAGPFCLYRNNERDSCCFTSSTAFGVGSNLHFSPSLYSVCQVLK